MCFQRSDHGHVLTFVKNIFDKLPDSVKRGGEPTETKKRRQASSPQSMHARPHALKQDSEFIAMGLRRASTFPESMHPHGKATMPLSQAHLANLGIGPYSSSAQSNGDYFEATPSLTPTSTTASSLGSYGLSAGPQLRPGHLFAGSVMNTMADATGLNVDINTMMFPSADPLAYPNQPMTTFEENHPQAFPIKHGSPTMTQLPQQYTGVDVKPSPASFTPSPLASVPPGVRRPDNEVQLLGPMPMYLMQGGQHRGFPPQPTMHGPQPHPLPGQHPPNMNFDDIFGGEEWAQTFLDPGLGLSGGPGFGGQPQYGPGGPGGPGMGGWQ